MVRGRFSDAEKAKIAELAGRGWKPGRIAVVLDRNASSVGYYMSTHGMVRSEVGKARVAFRRNGVLVVGFSSAEDGMIGSLRASGLSYSRVAAALAEKFGHRRTAQTVMTRLKWLSGRAV